MNRTWTQARLGGEAAHRGTEFRESRPALRGAERRRTARGLGSLFLEGLLATRDWVKLVVWDMSGKQMLEVANVFNQRTELNQLLSP